jgi:hypothetical protein
MLTEGSAVEEGTGSWQHSGESSVRHVRTGCRRFPQGRNSDGNGGTVTRLGGQDSGHRMLCSMVVWRRLTRVLQWSGWHLMLLSDGRVSRWVASSICRGEASGETELACSPRVGPLPLSEAEVVPLVRGGLGWAVPWCWATSQVFTRPHGRLERIRVL